MSSWLASIAAFAGDVRVTVSAADNLADAAEPVPTLVIANDSKDPIEVQLFLGVPFTMLEARDGSGAFARPGNAGCGNGYAPHVIASGQTESFPLWTRIDHGPGESGTYRIALPYTAIQGKRRVDREVASDPFELAYGDVAPRDPVHHAGAVVVVSAEAEHNTPASNPSPSALAAKLLPDAAACIAAAQRRVPWLRGRFTLVVYQYKNPAPTLFVSGSLLGDKAANACLGAIQVKDRVRTQLDLTFAVSPPT